MTSNDDTTSNSPSLNMQVNNRTQAKDSKGTSADLLGLADVSYDNSQQSIDLQPDLLSDSNDNDRKASTLLDFSYNSTEDLSYNTVDMLRDEVSQLTENMNDMCRRMAQMQRSHQQQMDLIQSNTAEQFQWLDGNYRSQFQELIEVIKVQHQPPQATANNNPSASQQQEISETSRTAPLEPEAKPSPSRPQKVAVMATVTNNASSESSRIREDPPEDPPERVQPKRKSSKSVQLPSIQEVTAAKETNDPDTPVKVAEVIEIIEDESPSETQVKKNRLHSPTALTYETSQSASTTSRPVRGTATAPPTGTAAPVNYVLPAKEIKFKLPTLHKNDRYSHWKGMCTIASSQHHVYTSLTYTDPGTGQLAFNPIMTLLESRALYQATVEALGSKASEVNTTADILTANGYSFWRKLDRIMNKTNQSFFQHEKLLNDLKSICKSPTETFQQYAARYDAQLEQVINSGATPPSHETMTLQLLKGCRTVDQVFSTTIMDLDQPGWHTGKSIHEIVDWAEERITKYKMTNKNSPVFLTDQKKEQPPKGEERYNNKASLSKLKNQQKDEFTKQPVNLTNEITKKLKSSKYVVADLFQLHGRFYDGCPLHNGANHKILECTQLARICQECNCTKDFQKVQQQLGFKTGGNRNNADTTDTKDKKTEKKVTAKRVSFQEESYEENKDFFEETDEEEEDESDNDSEVEDKSTKASVKGYMSSLPNLSLPVVLAKATINPLNHPKLPKQLKNIYRAVIDSGATSTMSPIKELFEEITYFSQDDSNAPTAELGDERTSVKICGYGPMTYNMHGKKIRTMALYVPDLGETTLFSVRQHIESKGCWFHASAGGTDFVFPNFIINPRTDHEIEVLIRPIQIREDQELDFDELTAEQTEVSTPKRTRKLFEMVNKYTQKYEHRC